MASGGSGVLPRPQGPKAHVLIPASDLLVVNDEGAILLQ